MYEAAESESLYAGPEALATIAPAALDEIKAILPNLLDGDTPKAARPLVLGRQGRRLAERHSRNQRALYRQARQTSGKQAPLEHVPQ